MSTDSSMEGRRPIRALFLVATVALVSICCCLWRFLHLFKGDHYYMVGPDSHFFHWQAEGVLAGQDIPMKLHSGLTYPLAHAAKGVSFVFGMPQTDALRWVGLLVGPALGVLSTVVLYVFVSRMYSTRVALFSAITWAVALVPVFICAAGYVDRDGLSVLLVMIGAFTLYVSRGWRLRIWGLDLGWLEGVAAVLVVGAALYVEWLYIGPLILLTIMVAFWVTEVIQGLGRSLAQMFVKSQVDMVETVLGWMRTIPTTLWRSAWRPLALVLCLVMVALAVSPGLRVAYQTFTSLATDSLGGTASVQEAAGMSLPDLVGYQLFIIPIVLGWYLTVKNGRRADWLILGWFTCLVGLGLVARRFLLFAAPAACVLSGVGLGYLLDLSSVRFSRGEAAIVLSLYDIKSLGRYALVGLGITVLLLGLVVSMPFAYHFGSVGLMAMNQDWEAGLGWMRDNTPQDAVVMSQWSFGYFILDFAGRRPVVDNGLYGWDEERNHDISTAYCTTDSSETARVMEKYDADYLVFSTVEYLLLPVMTEEGMGESYGDGGSIPSQMQGSVYARALSGNLVAEGGLRRVYPEDPGATNLSFVILALDSE